MKNDISIYFHIPFCIRKCGYCDFLSVPTSCGEAASQTVIDDYVRALKKELSCAGETLKERTVKTVYFGGGTPSLIPSFHITGIIKRLREMAEFSDLPEISIEMNPKTVDEEKILAYMDAGINRFSVGCQSVNDNELRALGRVHDHEDFLKTMEILKKCGAENINADIMTGIPYETLESAKRTLDEISNLGLSHISAYCLILEEGTPFFEKGSKKLHLPDEDLEMEIYEYTREFLSKKGYKRYEISNYALPGRKCLHNIVYWDCGDYLGFGAGAASRLRNRRFSNVRNVKSYINAPVNDLCEDLILSKEDEMTEFMIMGLRKTDGISLEDFFLRFGEDISDVYKETIGKFEKSGLLICKEGRLFLTERGLDVSNTVLSEFC
ncbi:MAG: radical SAM family heme chaperone HemW [Lachnospiraceae bacterium]|nr:radical SAM family heme chaperone HemW [Lachnospiraceae bacterium]